MKIFFCEGVKAGVGVMGNVIAEEDTWLRSRFKFGISMGMEPREAEITELPK